MVGAVMLGVLLHGLHATATLKGDRVRVEAFFDDDTPAGGAAIKVTAADGAVAAEGRADESGVWSFARPVPGKYTVVVDGGDGHRKKVSLTIPTDAELKQSAREQPPGDAEIIVTPGPTRREITRFPWLRAGMGLAAIGCLAAVLWLATRRRESRSDRI